MEAQPNYSEYWTSADEYSELEESDSASLQSYTNEDEAIPFFEAPSDGFLDIMTPNQPNFPLQTDSSNLFQENSMGELLSSHPEPQASSFTTPVLSSSEDNNEESRLKNLKEIVSETLPRLKTSPFFSTLLDSDIIWDSNFLLQHAEELADNLEPAELDKLLEVYHQTTCNEITHEADLFDRSLYRVAKLEPFPTFDQTPLLNWDNLPSTIDLAHAHASPYLPDTPFPLQDYTQENQIQVSKPIEASDVQIRSSRQICSHPKIVVAPDENQDSQPIRSKIKKFIRKKWCIVDQTDVSDFEKLVPNPILKFPFLLDTFQKRAIYQLEQNRHVFVAAHTSAGKTVVAEYAAALAMHRGRKIVYTSPIKSLSNQKYRDFKRIFDSVGIITGDVSLNPDASCLVVTTEILLTMLYRGSPIISNLDCVVFDEVHYVNDRERGVVWEEAIILLPSSVKMLMLSATVSNYAEFADWVGSIKKKEVVTIYTDKRPVPLIHSLYFYGKMFLMKSSDGQVDPQVYHRMYEHMRLNTPVQKVGGAKSSGPGPKNAGDKKQNSSHRVNKDALMKKSLHKLLDKLSDQDRLPAIVFCFSRAYCEKLAKSVRLNFIKNRKEKHKIDVFTKLTLKSLSEEDANLPQVLCMISLLQKGIAWHHTGLLPVLKEMVEILYSRGLIQVLFATETVAMGINLPARSIIFSDLKKFDGHSHRILYASEYTQMAGRAGRRGLDDTGYVYILCLDKPPNQLDLKEITSNVVPPLKSNFRLRYQMILELHLRANLTIEEMLRRSFMEAENSKTIPVLSRNLMRLKQEKENIVPIECIYGEPTMKEYYKLCSDAAMTPVHSVVANMRSTSGFANGRILILYDLPFFQSPCLATILSCNNSTNPITFDCLILLPNNQLTASNLEIFDDPSEDQIRIIYESNIWGVSEDNDSNECIEYVYKVCCNIKHSNVLMLCSHILKLPPTSYFSDYEIIAQELVDQVHHLSSISSYCLAGKQWKALSTKYSQAILDHQKSLRSLFLNKCHNCPKRESHYQQIKRENKIISDIQSVQSGLRMETVPLFVDMKQKVKLLKSLHFINCDGTASIKGYAATLISCDNLTIVEVIFNNILQNLTVPEAAAALSGFVYEGKDEDELSYPTYALREAIEKIQTLQNTIKMYEEQLYSNANLCAVNCTTNFNLLGTVYKWASGNTFQNIVSSTTIQEGIIVRNILRLDELVRSIHLVAVKLNLEKLAELMMATSTAIRRDIIFFVSLYLR